MRVLVIGASGMIGSTLVRILSEESGLDVFGTIRNENVIQHFPATIRERMISSIDVEHHDALIKVLNRIRPNVVVNCAGLIKHKPVADDLLFAIPINTLMPHRLAGLCRLIDARLIHVSTDCVFTGEKGGYLETDFADARDVYGRSKALGEVTYPHTITLRTSTIGHEFQNHHGLLEWFLSQQGRCKGYSRAVFSGLPSVVFAQVIRDLVIPRSDLSGLYHIAAKPINKYDLLKLIAKVYGKRIEIEADGELEIDRSLNAERFREATGYVAPKWDKLIETMYRYR